MKTTAFRLRQIMNERNLRQIDILNMSIPFQKKYDIFMNKTNLSQYVNGKSNPDQHKLFLLGKTLNVNEAWLMGYDVSMERQNPVVAEGKNKIIENYNKLDDSRKNKVDHFIDNQLKEQQKNSQHNSSDFPDYFEKKDIVLAREYLAYFDQHEASQYATGEFNYNKLSDAEAINLANELKRVEKLEKKENIKK